MLLMRRYGWTPDQVNRLAPLWYERLVLVESYTAQIAAEEERRSRSKSSQGSGGRRGR